ncbi:MAG TPA: LysR family transcriptional regulator [Bryobacteraceae bacterium]|nr:LysR family transcriptional regulator [Bryobacteraceae bacterium]
MTLENLRLFRDIAQTRSLSRAAEMNHITPSAASQQINEVERSLGVTLLDRSTRPLTLTPEGRLYQDMCRDVLRRSEEFQASLDHLKSEVAGTVRVAAIYSVGLSEMSELEAEFQRRLPAARLEVEYLRPEKVYEYVAADRVDLGLVSYPEPTREIAVLPWRREEMMLATGPAHPLASRGRIYPSDLNGVDFVTFDDDLPIGREISRYLRTHGVEVNTTMHFDNIQTIKEAVILGSGVSIIPARILHSEIADGRLRAVPLSEPGLFRPLGIVHRKKKRFHPAAQAFLHLLQESPTAHADLVPAI